MSKLGHYRNTAGQKIQELLIACEKEKEPFARSHKQLALVNKKQSRE